MQMISTTAKGDLQMFFPEDRLQMKIAVARRAEVLRTKCSRRFAAFTANPIPPHRASSIVCVRTDETLQSMKSTYQILRSVRSTAGSESPFPLSAQDGSPFASMEALRARF